MDNETKSFVYICMVVFLIVLGLIFNPIKIVSEGEVGVVKHFGRLESEVLEPGMHFKWSVVNKIIKMESRVKKTEMTANAGTKDLQTVDVKVAVNYRLQDFVDIYRNLGDDDTLAERIINPAVQEVVKANVSGFTASELLTKRQEVKELIDTQLTERLKQYNIVVGDVSIINLEYSDAFNRAVEAKQVAEQQNQQATYELEKAKKEIERMRLEKSQISQMTLQKLWIEKWNGVLPTYVGDGKNLINIPIK